ncbi:hypothetical protein ASC77_11190 [Nocardioides sp. Root1257]|uniref:hypothetical protein n=1 Tax=unclassified Nocardioides TaxID=2615069 RepID=UPI0006F6E9EC|nr:MULTISPECIES: hypothetical protein [unclassified Nocardioides]KQW49245.1 hypothetical protein ASC77_11190 [Nocardioides sp. Root1257]KRC48419.1 hypothetical protein ASE24_11195 [Nocardioides sp. Root224]
MTTDLRELLHDEIDRVIAPPGDLDAVRAGGQRLRRRRGAAAVAGAALVVGAVVAGFAVGGSTDPGSERGVDPVGRLDFSQGLRAYADPGEVIHLGGREFGAARMSYLDTDAAATPYGVLFYDRGRPMLLEESGVSVALETDVDATRSHPTAKADSQSPLVAYGVTRDGQAEAVVRDLSSDEQVGRLAVPQGTIIDALDAGVVFLRTDDGTTTWDPRTGETQDLAGPETRVADVRNGVLLYDGPAPDGPAAAAYRLVKGTVDAQLTFDGGHVLD